MKRFILATVGLVFMLLMCGGMSKSKVEKVYDRYIEEYINLIKKYGVNNVPEKEVKLMQNKIVKDEGFENWADFHAKAMKLLGKEYSKILEKKLAKLNEKVKTITIEQTTTNTVSNQTD